MEERATFGKLAVRLVDLASKVHADSLPPIAAVRALSTEFGLNQNSSRDYLTGVRAMLLGKQYQHGLNLSVTKAVLDEIIARDGITGAISAISSVRQHISYYSNTNGNSQPSLAAYCNELENNIAESKHQDAHSFENLVQGSMRLSSSERKKLLPLQGHKPSVGVTTVKSFNRNQHVVAEILLRANGLCEGCGKDAPFIKKSTRQPYLEVHHKVWLAENGDDTVDNAEALCPNCHRERHFG